MKFYHECLCYNYLPMLNMPKSLLKLFLSVAVAAVFLFVPIFSQLGYATQDEDLNALKSKSDSLTKQMNDLQKQIDSAKNNQSSVNFQIQQYSNLIESTELQIEQKQLTIQMTQDNLSKMNSQKDTLMAAIGDLQIQVDGLKKKADNQTMTISQIDRQPTVGLIASKSLKEIFVNKAFQNNAKAQIKEVYNELTSTQTDLETKETELNTTIKSSEDLIAQITSEKQQLEDTQNGLAQQKASKNQQIQQLQASISQKSQAKDALGQEALKVQAQVAQLQYSILGTRPSGSPIKKGDIIGLEGNSGDVCGYSTDKVGVHDACSSRFGSGWFLPATQNDNCSAAHVHFGLSLNGKTYVNPATYIADGTIGKPLSSYVTTQVYGANPQAYGAGGHPAIDLHQYCGAPVLAAMDGTLTYGCDNFKYNPAKYAMIYNPTTKMQTIYWHLKKGSGECR